MAAKGKKSSAKPKKAKAAKKPAAAAPAPPPPETPKKKNRRAVTNSPGIGHNLPPGKLTEMAEGLMKEAFELQASMDSDMAGYRSDFKELYRKAGNELGMKASQFAKEFRRALRIKREKEKEAMMDSKERADAVALREALAGTPLGDWFAGDLAEPAEVEAEADETRGVPEPEKADA